MSYRTYDAGTLPRREGVTRSTQLAHAANFENKAGHLYLLRCMACTDSPRGRENYLPAAATGQCAWCGWKEEAR